MLPLHKWVLCALPTVCWASQGGQSSPTARGAGFSFQQHIHSSFCSRYLLFVFFSHLQDFTAVKAVLKQDSHCYGQRHITVPAFTKVLSLFQTGRICHWNMTTNRICHNRCYPPPSSGLTGNICLFHVKYTFFSFVQPNIIYSTASFNEKPQSTYFLQMGEILF